MANSNVSSHFTSKECIAMNSVNLSAALSSVSESWKPATVARFNGNEIMVAKASGSYPWHKHDFFLVLKGSLTIEMRDSKVCLGPGEMFVVPRGVEHRPVATEEAHFILIEPPGTAKNGTTYV
jgi:mannose-6-phosphate isomerase-like protein (cupin superfamily)